MSDDVLIRVEGVSKKFCRRLKRSLWYGVQDTIGDLLGRDNSAQGLRREEFWAVDDVSFELRRGECLGLVGRNGAGKTTLLKMLNGLIKPDRGRIEMHGRVGGLISLGAGFNPILTGRENIYINGAVLGLSRSEIERKIDGIIEFAEIDDFIDAPVQSYSSGMHVRLGFAVATALEPDVLLLDEVLAVGDAAFRAKCFERIGKILVNSAVVFVSHSEPQIYRICNQALLLSGGKIINQGTPESVLAAYRIGEGHVRPDESKITDKRVIGIQLRTNSKKLKYGSQLEVTATIDVATECKIGGIVVHLWRNGEFVANGDILLSPKNALVLAPGTSNMSVTIGPLNLQAGKYTLSFTALDETRKQTMLHWLHFSEIEVVGPLGAGPAHLLPMTIALGDRTIGYVASQSEGRAEKAGTTKLLVR